MTYMNYYEILEINTQADQDEIKKAYRRLAMQFHPDVNTDPAAEDRFKKINEAYDVLSDSGKRLIYDRTGKTGGYDRDIPSHMRYPGGMGMGRCMGKCSGFDAIFRRGAQYHARKKRTQAQQSIQDQL